MSELVTYGTGNNTISFRGSRIMPGTLVQQYSGIRTGPGVDRTALNGLTKVKISDFSGGLHTDPSVHNWIQNLNKYSYNQGWQTRLPGLMVLPYVIKNQTTTGIGSTNLVAYWPLDEASGNAIDAFSTNDLTETGGTIASASGNLGNARDFEAEDTEWFEAGDSAWNSITGDMTIVAWVNAESLSGDNRSVVSKAQFGGSNQSYDLKYQNSTSRWIFECSADGAAQARATANSFGAPSTGTWMMLCARHRNGSNLGISVNAGTEDTTSFTGGIFNSTAKFIIGAKEEGTDDWFDGLIQHVSLWNRVLTDAEVTWLYNGGVGRLYTEVVGVDADISGYVAANKKAFEINSAVGSSTGARYYKLTGTKMYRANATTGALEVADTFTNNVTAIGELSVNGEMVFAVATDGTTDGIKYTTDPTAATISWTTLVNLSSGDYVQGMRFLPTLGPRGCNIFNGKIGGVNSAAWFADAFMTSSTQLEAVVSSSGSGTFPSYTRNVTAESFFADADTYLPDSPFTDGMLPRKLIGWWPLNEGSGNALDASSNGRTLTDNNTVGAGAAAGNIDFRDFESTASESFSALDAAWNSVTGDLDILLFVQLESTGADRTILSKWTESGDQRSYRLWYDNAASRFKFSVSSAGTAATVTTVTASTFGAPSTGVTYFIRAYHDATNDILSISVNNGTADTTAHSTGIFDGTGAFRLSAHLDGAGAATAYHDGLIGAASMWGSIMSAANVSAYYNSGSGLDAATILGVGEWIDSTNALTNDGSSTSSVSLSLNEFTPILALRNPTVTGPASSDRILGIAINIEHSSTNDRAQLYSVQLAVDGTAVGVARYPESDLPGQEVLLGPNDTMFAELTGADLANLEVWITYVARASTTVVSVDYVSITVYYAADAPQRIYARNQIAVGVDKDLSGTPVCSWLNPTGVLSDDAVVTSVTNSSGAPGVSDYLLYGPLVPAGAYPATALLTGLQFDFIDTDATNPTARDETVQLYRTASLIGLDKAKSSDFSSWGTNTRNRSYGREGDLWAAGLEAPDDLSDVYLALQITLSNSETMELDYIRFHISYILAGTTTSLPVGGWLVARNPVYPLRMTLVTPTDDETSTVLKPRELWHLDFTWDSTGARPLLTISQPNEGMQYVHHVAPFQGGWAITGGEQAGMGRFLKHVDGSGNLRDFGFPASHNGNEVRINSIRAQGPWLILDVVTINSSGTVTDRQWWLYNNGRYYCDTLLQSLSDGMDIAAQPLGMGQTALNLKQSLIYSMFPNGTDTGVARQFMPPDLGADPRTVNLSEVRTVGTTSSSEDTTLKLRSMELDIGPEEALKALTVVSYHGRRISAGTGASYGSVTFEAVTDGDTTFASPEVSNTFTSAYSTYNVPSSGEPFTSLIFRISGTHDAGSVDSPDGLPFLLTTAQEWPHEKNLDFIVDEFLQPNNFIDFMSQMKTLQAEQLTQPLAATNLDEVAVYDGLIVPRAGIMLPPTNVQIEGNHLIDLEGNDVKIGVRFHTVPGTV